MRLLNKGIILLLLLMSMSLLLSVLMIVVMVVWDTSLLLLFLGLDEFGYALFDFSHLFSTIVVRVKVRMMGVGLWIDT